MRPLPEIRSRTQINNNSNGIEPHSSSSDSNQRLTNGSLKEPIVTRSKSVKLKLRRRPSRSPLKAQSPAKNYTSDSSNSNGSLRRKEKTCNSSTSTSSSTKQQQQGGRRDKEDNNVNSRSTGVYARHYNSYRRSGLSSSLKGSGDSDGKFSSQNCQRSLNSRRVRPYSNNGVKSSTGSSLRSGVSYKSRASAIEKRKKIGNLMNKNKARPKKLVSSNSSSTTITPLSSPTSSHFTSDPDASNKDKGAKRRSALWVLNCEAEEFLFGETAADKHELELPPSTDSSAESPPPKKRRRWRETELSHLLETSPFLESKLRSCSSSSESGRDSFNISPPPKIKKFRIEERTGRPAGKGKSRLSFQPESPPKCSSSKPISASRVDSSVPVISRNLELLSPTSSIRSNCSTFRDPVSDSKTVQVRQMLSSMPWRFSFEDPPVDESWFATFSRPGDAIMSYMSFLPPYFEPIVLPYEMDKPFRRSRVKLPKNSRKSPRCHASTLAILSSETPTRSTRNSLNTESASAPIAQVVPTVLPADTSLDSLLSNPPVVPVSAPSSAPPATSKSSVSPITKFMRENCIPLRSKSPNVAKETSRIHQVKRQDVSAQQYLWDSIQFLSDPYVVDLLSSSQKVTNLSGDEAEFLPFISTVASKTRSRHNSSYNGTSNGNAIVCPVKKLVQNFEALERKASLRSCDSGGSNTPGASSAGKEGSAMGNGAKLIPLPKASPRNHSHGTNHVNGTSVVNNSGSQSSIRVLSVNGISKSLENRSPKSPTSEHRVHNNSKPSTNHANGTPSKTSKSNIHNKSLSSDTKSRSKPGSPTEMDESGRSCRGKPSTRRSPVVMVSDIFKNGKTKAKKLILEEELLFLGDGLPPLPSWPV